MSVSLEVEKIVENNYIYNNENNLNVENTEFNLSTVTIFDWDDTLLCSTWLVQHGINLETTQIPLDIRESLQLLEKAVIELLTKAKTYGPVYIITNAGYGWVQMSAKKFLPNVYPILSDIRIISARALYEPYYPPMFWKRCAFQFELNQLYANCDKLINVISFGDSASERFATNSLEFTNQSFKKFVQFRERLEPSQMTQAISYILGQLDMLVFKCENLDLLLFM